MDNLFNSEVFTYLILPILIFIARICDVSIGTLRIIFLSKGKKNVAPILGFFEVLIWIIAIGKIFKDADNWICYFAYAGGFATGNLVGMIIEEKLAVGVVVLRIIMQKGIDELTNGLSEAGFGYTKVDAHGSKGEVSVLYTTIKRNSIPKVSSIIKEANPEAFFTIEDVRMVKQGIFPTKEMSRWRKGK